MVSESYAKRKYFVRYFLLFYNAQYAAMKPTKKQRRRAGMALWGRFQEAMAEAKIKNQAQLARDLGVTSQTISGWKRGAWKPTRENYIALAILSGMAIDYLETGEGARFPYPKNDLEDRVLSVLRQLPEDRQERVLSLAEFELSRGRGK